MEISTVPYILKILQPKARTKAIQTTTTSHRHRHTHTHMHTHTHTRTHTHARTHTHTAISSEKYTIFFFLAQTSKLKNNSGQTCA